MGFSRSGFYFEEAGESVLNITLMRLIDEQFLETPWYGRRQMVLHLRRLGYHGGGKRGRRLMRKLGLMAIYQKPRTSIPHPEHKVYPYLLRGVAIEKPNHVWCADISYIPIRRGFLYLVAIMDWHSRKVLSWRLSNTVEADFCVTALEDALGRYGTPDIFNTDQGSQFTSQDFTQTLRDANVRISMDGRGRWMDNVMIERLWRSLKYECVYLRAFETGSEARAGIGQWGGYYNANRPHSSLDDMTPDEVYCGRQKPGPESKTSRQPPKRHNGTTGSTLFKPPTCPTDGDHLSSFTNNYLHAAINVEFEQFLKLNLENQIV